MPDKSAFNVLEVFDPILEFGKSPDRRQNHPGHEIYPADPGDHENDVNYSREGQFIYDASPPLPALCYIAGGSATRPLERYMFALNRIEDSNLRSGIRFFLTQNGDSEAVTEV